MMKTLIFFVSVITTVTMHGKWLSLSEHCNGIEFSICRIQKIFECSKPQIASVKNINDRPILKNHCAPYHTMPAKRSKMQSKNAEHNSSHKLKQYYQRVRQTMTLLVMKILCTSYHLLSGPDYQYYYFMIFR